MTPRPESGSATIEAVIGLPAFILFVGLIIFGGRTATAHGAVESAAADAARSASISRTSDHARTDAHAAARASLANQQIDCTQITVEVDVSGFAKRVGEPGFVDVTVTCRLDLSDLAVPGVPGARTIRAHTSSPIDTWTERS
ncbi:hypothetical protein BHE97_06530 [Aeromicrobium sp. PE09-221]|uniref:TadE family protein n=1 Tax=Aeromicrobium sp. PE09-221 TaxID=1898043 RepID=UPI000B3E5A46|nr:TadE family protein [Aeromicrobium sp. PE09-221]OUZ11078.1 hypothetical protein BHE97_06530 [Aeromicrobium sp. PE09-221]